MKTHQNPFDTQGLRQDFHQKPEECFAIAGLDPEKQFVADLVVLWKVGCIAGLSFDWVDRWFHLVVGRRPFAESFDRLRIQQSKE